VHAGPNPEDLSCDVLVAGAGMGGEAAALTAAGRGHSVCLTDETD
jgi:glycerol-3-phosphate dehydrogenase